MWTKRDWIYLGVSAVAAFGVTWVGFSPSNATADGPTPAVAINAPTLDIEGVSISGNTIKGDSWLGVVDSTTLVKPGLLPQFELRAVNTTGSERSVRFSASLLTSRIPNPLSRVPMPTESPKSQWMEDLTLDLKPGESRVIPISTDLVLAPMSAATLRLESGGQKVDALAMSTGPKSLAKVLGGGPATQPSNVGGEPSASASR
jgi:hypothetical protein